MITARGSGLKAVIFHLFTLSCRFRVDHVGSR